METRYIRLEEAIEALRAYKCGETDFDDCIDFAISLVSVIPAADVRPVVRGTWLSYPVLDDMCYQHYSCSVCKRVEAIPHGYDVKKELPYCHCGAYMMEGGGNE